MDLVVFDLDGTLIDSRLDIAGAANHTLRTAGYAERSTEEITSFVGDGASQLIAKALGLSDGDERLRSLVSDFLHYYEEHPADHTVILPDVRETLSRLSAYTLAVCTNKPRSITLKVLEALKLAPYFAEVCAGDDTPVKKPDPAPLLRVCNALGIAPQRSVIVGDGWQDILCGRRAGARTVGVQGGMGSYADLLEAKPDAVLTMKDLPVQLTAWQTE